MDDHMDLIAKIKSEPSDSGEINKEHHLVFDDHEKCSEDANEFIRISTDLGILNNIMKSFDEITKNQTDLVELTIEDGIYSYLVTIKRLNKITGLNLQRQSPEYSTTKHSTCEDTIRIEKEIHSRKLVRHNDDEISCLPSVDLCIDNDDKIIIETVDDFDDTEIVEGLQEDSAIEKVEVLIESEEELMLDSEEEVNQIENNTDEIQNGEINVEMSDNSFTGPDTEEDDNILENINCEDDTEIESNCHNENHQDNRIFKKENSFDECHEIIISEDNCIGNDLVDEDIDESKTKDKIKTKRLRKRDKALHDFLYLLNSSSEIIKPLNNLNRKKENIESNLENTSESIKNHKCMLCNFSCCDTTELYRHIGLTHAHNPNEHYNKGNLRTDCVFCPFEGLTRKSLLMHLRTKHQGGKGYACDQCNYKTHHKSNFDRHVEVVHDKKRDVNCPECGFSTTRNYLLEKHILYKHRGVKPYCCTEPGCNFGSTSSSNRKAHIMEVHRGLRPNICPVNGCDFGTSRRFVLKNHLFKEHNIGDAPTSSNVSVLPEKDGSLAYPCPHCPHKATQKGNLQKHIRIKHFGHIKRYKCAECDFTASDKCFVKTHISEVHLGQFLFTCNLCTFKTSVRQRFDRHYNAVHLKQKPFSCQMCDYKGSQSIHLQRHIEVIHRGEKPHYCTYCSFNTAHRANLRAHLKAIHKISDEHMNEVLQSCLDTREKKKRGCKPKKNRENYSPDQKYQTLSETGHSEETITPESLNTIKVTVEVPEHEQTINSSNVYDINSLEASLVLGKIGETKILTEVSEDNITTERVIPMQQVIPVVNGAKNYPT